MVAGGALAFAFVGGDDDQSKVEAHATDAVPAAGDLNRADDLGADVVRAYLQAVLSCSPEGERLMAALSSRGETAARNIMRDACRTSRGRPFADRLEAEVVIDELDQAGRALWRVAGSDGALPRDLVLRVRQSAGSDGWEIDRPCRGACPA